VIESSKSVEVVPVEYSIALEVEEEVGVVVMVIVR
jgi:hypothetical protein